MDNPANPINPVPSVDSVPVAPPPPFTQPPIATSSAPQFNQATPPPQPVVPPITPPQMAVPPTPPPAQTFSSVPESPKSKKVILLIIAVSIGLLIVGLSIFFGLKFVTRLKGGTVSTGTTTKVASKYAADTDSDGIPDAIEVGAGLDPKTSELTRCALESCDSQTASTAQTTQNNILFIIDSSGSMGLQIGGKTKMDLAKDAIRNFMKTVASNVSVGIMVYGDKGSNAASDKTISCGSADMIASIGSVTSTTVDTYLSQIQPVGWTPIGLAITKGKDAFVGKEGQKNQIIVVTDGAETCDSNPTGAATEAKNSAYQIRVDVIGFAVTSAEQASLQAISTNGGGTFSLASNADDLYNQLKANQENFNKFLAGSKCTTGAYQKSIDCLMDAKTKAFNYLESARKGLTGTANQEIYDIETNVTTTYQKKIYELQDQENAALINNRQNLLNQ